MFNSLRSVAGILLPGVLCSAAAFGQITSTGAEPAPSYDVFTPPAAGATYTDPVFGSKIQRVSNAMGTPNADAGGNLNWVENEYSTMSAFNSDNSYFILVQQSYFGLYSGATGTFMHALPLEISASSEPRWSRTDNVTLYYHAGNQLKSYNVSTAATAVVHTFTGYGSISGMGEMDISLDGDHFVFAADNRYIFVYQISTGTTYNVLDAGSNRFDSVYITPRNNVIVSWLTNGTSRYNGQELFDINMNFQRQLSDADGHKDVTVDSNGDEVLIWTNSDDPRPIANCNNGIVKIRLADAKQTCLLQLDWSLAVHISAPDGNGTVFVDTEAPANPMPGTSGWVPYTDELLQVKLDGSQTIRWAHHRSVPVNSYNWQPKASVSRDGTRVLYASNFDLSALSGTTTEYADTYMLTIPATGTTSTTSGGSSSSTGSGSTSGGSTSTSSTGSGTSSSSGSTSSPATQSTVVQETSATVHYTGTWFPNRGAFNLGGSAKLATDGGSSAAFTFTGTGIQWIGFSDAWSGIAKVYVDGALKATVDTYAAAQKAQKVQFTATNLTNGTHTLTIASTGTKSSASSGAWVWIDAFVVTAPSAAQSTSSSTSTTASSSSSSSSSTPVIYTQKDPAVAYAGTWYPNTGAASLSGSSVLAMDAGASATFTFSGTSVSWIGYRDPWSGIAQVYLDGKLAATVDTYSADTLAKTTVYNAGNLASGSHTLQIKATGTKSSVSGGAWVWVQGFSVTP